MKKKLLALILSVAVVASIAAAGTLAYLTSQDSVVNNFQVGTKGQVNIELDEALVDETGKAVEGADRVDFNDYVNMLPGQVLDKDPTVHVMANSAESYVFVSVINQLGEDGALNINTDAWEFVEKIGTQDVYMYIGEKTVRGSYNVVAATENDSVDLEPLFTTVTVNKDLDADGLKKLDNKQIIVLAYAIQAANLAVEPDVSNNIEGKTATDVAYSEASGYFTEAAKVLSSGELDNVGF